MPIAVFTVKPKAYFSVVEVSDRWGWQKGLKIVDSVVLIVFTEAVTIQLILAFSWQLPFGWKHLYLWRNRGMKYKGCSESNASYFIKLTHDIGGGMAVEDEPSHQHPTTVCCCVTDGSREAVWQNGVWHGTANEAKVCHWIPSCRKHFIHWHSSTLAERFWRANSGCERNEVMGGAVQHWWQWVTSAGAGCYECSMKALVHSWQKCIAEKLCIVSDN